MIDVFLTLAFASFGIFTIVFGILTAYLGKDKTRIAGGGMVITGLIVTLIVNQMGNFGGALNNTLFGVLGSIIGVVAGVLVFLGMIIKIP